MHCYEKPAKPLSIEITAIVAYRVPIASEIYQDRIKCSGLIGLPFVVFDTEQVAVHSY